MKITKVEPIVLRVPQAVGLDEDDIPDCLVVRVETDEGIVGIGETAGFPLALVPMVRSAHPGTWYRGFEDHLVGEDPLQVQRLWDKMFEYSLHYGSRGLIIYVMSAIDMAIWDIVGKYKKQPIFKLLGGSKSDSIPAYASLPPYPSETELLSACDAMVSRGFTALKFHTDPPRLHDGTWVKFTKAAREHLGAKVTLMLDAHNGFGTEEAIRFAKSLEPYDLYFLEAALLPDNLDGYAKLSSSASMMIAAGEEFTTRFMYLDLMDRGKIDVVQVDAELAGGITEGKRVADLAKERGIIYVPHCWGTDISFAANLHVAAAADSPYVEWPLSKSPLRNELTNERFTLGSDGRVPLPDRPGLGVTLDEKIVEKYRYRGPFSHY
jgi:L-alanine-DL-glutamate epimerase-like enolase superfamily enzyme